MGGESEGRGLISLRISLRNPKRLCGAFLWISVENLGGLFAPNLSFLDPFSVSVTGKKRYRWIYVLGSDWIELLEHSIAHTSSTGWGKDDFRTVIFCQKKEQKSPFFIWIDECFEINKTNENQ